ncbi:MAG: hypothetical protein IJW63_04790 [Lachnospiraceae bacterium]|nr:hypothetical protein [Lachnospiraceae bacterium]
MNAKKWNYIVIGCTFGALLLLALITIVIDPFLHYHDGLLGLQYPLKDERYQNDGIARHYDYDGIITGTSMCQNFKPSEFDALWGGKTVKLTHSGASFCESRSTIKRALDYQPEIKYVLCSLDGTMVNYPANQNTYDGYPEYFYDENPFNDVNYFLNKEVLPKTVAVLNYTRAGNKTTSMDEYGFWGAYKSYGKETVLASFTLVEEHEEEYALSETDKEQITENVTENLLKLALDNPDVTFYLFFPPYSVCFWEALERTNQLELQIEAQKIATEILLEADNIEVYDFSLMTDITGNLDNYTDTLHYGPWINSEILIMINEKTGLLTKENYDKHWSEVQSVYQYYDYSMYKK